MRKPPLYILAPVLMAASPLPCALIAAWVTGRPVAETVFAVAWLALALTAVQLGVTLKSRDRAQDGWREALDVARDTLEHVANTRIQLTRALATCWTRSGSSRAETSVSSYARTS